MRWCTPILWKGDFLSNYFKKMIAFGPQYFFHVAGFKIYKGLYKKSIISKKFLVNEINRYQRYIYKKTEYLISPILDEYSTNRQDEKHEFSQIVWVMWMQGLEDAPEIVKLCVNSIKNNSGYSDVRVLTDSNIETFVDIPVSISEGVNDGRISRALYSDYIRFKVLSQYGGVWLDSTCYCSGPLPKDTEQLEWTSAKGIEDFEYNGFPSKQFPYIDQWVSYYLSSTKGSLFSKVVCDSLEYYINAGFPLIDYFVVFYIAKIVRERIPQVKIEFGEIKDNNTKCEQLWSRLATASDDISGIAGISNWLQNNENTVIYKLSYRRFTSDSQKQKIINIIRKIEE